jgi:sugar phosphate isomerase/epimerase
MKLCANLTKNIKLNELLSEINCLGFRHAQFSFVHYGINDENPSLDSTFVDKARKMNERAKDNRLDFPVVHGWLPTSRNEAMGTLTVYIDVRNILASDYVVIHPKDNDNLVAIIELLQNHKSKEFIIIENVAEPDFKMGLNEIKMVLKAGINLCFDTCHALESGLNIDYCLDKFHKDIKVMHLSDFDGTKRHMVIGANITELFVNKIPRNMIVVFEHKAKTIDEYRLAYTESLKRFTQIRSSLH